MNNKVKNKVFMAFATGKESTEGQSIKRYIGVAPVSVLTVNPTKEELESIYNIELENQPEYISTLEIESNGTKHKVNQARIDFVVQTDEEKSNNINLKTKVTFFLRQEPRYDKNNTKVQVINKYGEFTWITIEDAKKGTLPENQKWFDSTNMRPAYVGEEELTKFIKTYLNIPNKSYRKKNGEIVELENLSEAEARLDKIEDYFKGDFTEIKQIAKLQPNNKIKCLFGVRTTGDNKQYQAVYTHKFLKNHINDYSSLDEDLQIKKSNGMYSTTEFEVCELKEYAVIPTDFTNEVNSTGDCPFDSWGTESTPSSAWFGK